MAKAKKIQSAQPSRGFSARLKFVGWCFAMLGVALMCRLAYLQILQRTELSGQAERHYRLPLKVSYGRGKIMDRNHNELAANLDVESVFARPSEVTDKAGTAKILAEALGLDYKTTLRRLSSKRHFIWIKRKSAMQETEKLKALNLEGIGFEEEQKRFYPKRELAASAIGFVGMDNQGLAGVEHYYESTLRGVERTVYTEKDNRNRNIRIAGLSGVEGEGSGADIILTLDEVIQFIAEQQLNKQVEAFQAKGGTAIVMNPETGEIYALATAPRYNPNNHQAYEPQRYARNPAVADALEPGSIFKPLVVAAAIHAGAVKAADSFFCENGSYKVAGNHYVKEATGHKFGLLSLSDIIAKSSNIGAVKVVEKLGKAELYKRLRAFGFGEKTGIEISGEASGQLRDLAQWSGRSASSISFGQEIGVTPVQMITAFSAIANGGQLLRPQIVKAVVRNGKVAHSFQPQVVNQVIDASAGKQTMEMLKGVVKEGGTGVKAAVKGFDVAGKTGTAQKIDADTLLYSPTAFLASFIGFAPADAPRLAILVMIDEPKRVYWGGEVAAPVFKEIAEQSLRYLGIPAREERVMVLDRV